MPFYSVVSPLHLEVRMVFKGNVHLGVGKCKTCIVRCPIFNYFFMASSNTTSRSAPLQSKDQTSLYSCSANLTPVEALTFQLPDFIATCSHPFNINSHYPETAVVSDNWLHDHGVHRNEAHRRAFQDCNFGLLVAYSYPNADETRFHITCVYFNILFAFDDLTDEGGLRMDADGTRKASDIVMGAFFSPHTYETTFKLGRLFGE